MITKIMCFSFKIPFSVILRPTSNLLHLIVTIISYVNMLYDARLGNKNIET